MLYLVFRNYERQYKGKKIERKYRKKEKRKKTKLVYKPGILFLFATCNPFCLYLIFFEIFY